MRKAQFILLLAAGLVLTALQASAFTLWLGNGEDQYWSNTNNWNNGIGGIDDPDVRFRLGDPGDIINVDITGVTNKVMNFYATCTAYTIANNPLVFNNGTPDAAGNLIVNSSTNIQTFKNDLIFEADGSLDYVNGGTGGLIFDGSVSFTGTNEVQFSVGSLTFNNRVYAENVIRISSVDVTFAGAESNDINSIVFVGDGAALTVDTADNMPFYEGGKFQHNATDVTAVLNSANVIGDDTGINVNGKSATYTFNADEDLGNLLLRDGQLHLVLGDTVTSLSFDDSSAQDWVGGSVIITNFRSGVIQFGTDAAGLTSTQITQIATDVSGTLMMDASGYLHVVGSNDIVNVVDFSNDPAVSGVVAARAVDSDTPTGDTWNFSDTVAMIDGTAEENFGRSNLRIYGGMKTYWSPEVDYEPGNRLPSWDTVYQLQINSDGDGAGGVATEGYRGMLVWNRADFLNGAGTNAIAFNALSSMTAGFSVMNGTYRFAVNNAGTYYVSQTSFSGAGPAALGPAADNWAVISTDENYTIGTYTAQQFSDIRGVGLYMEGEETGNQVLVKLSDFQVSAGLSEIIDVEIGDVSMDTINGHVVMSWQGMAGASYAVQVREDLVTGSWSNFVEGINGIDGLISVTNSTDFSQAFFRTIAQ